MVCRREGRYRLTPCLRNEDVSRGGGRLSEGWVRPGGDWGTGRDSLGC